MDRLKISEDLTDSESDRLYDLTVSLSYDCNLRLSSLCVAESVTQTPLVLKKTSILPILLSK